MMWERDENRLAVVELVHTGRLRRRKSQEEVWTWLAQLRWTKATGRRDEVALTASVQGEVEDMLDSRWPEWRTARARLTGAGLPVSHEGWKALQDAERAGRAGRLPRRLNERTAAAQVGPHSKAGLTDARRSALAGTVAPAARPRGVRNCSRMRILDQPAGGPKPFTFRIQNRPSFRRQ